MVLVLTLARIFLSQSPSTTFFSGKSVSPLKSIVVCSINHICAALTDNIAMRLHLLVYSFNRLRPSEVFLATELSFVFLFTFLGAIVQFNFISVSKNLLTLQCPSVYQQSKHKTGNGVKKDLNTAETNH